MDYIISFLLVIWCCINYAGSCSDGFSDVTGIRVCEAQRISGQMIAIIAEGAPTDTTCTCDVLIRGGTNNLIQYSSPGYDNCGVRFAMNNYQFACSDSLIKINSSFQVTFEKSVHTEGPEACFAILMDTSVSSMAIIKCTAAGTLITTTTSTTTTTATTTVVATTTPIPTTSSITTATSHVEPVTSTTTPTTTSSSPSTPSSTPYVSIKTSSASTTVTTQSTSEVTPPVSYVTSTAPSTTTPTVSSTFTTTPTSVTTTPLMISTTTVQTQRTTPVITTHTTIPTSTVTETTTPSTQTTTGYNATGSDITGQPLTSETEDKEYTVVIIVSILGGCGVLVFAVAIGIICRKQLQSKEHIIVRHLEGLPIDGYAAGNVVVVDDADLWDTSPRYTTPRKSMSTLNKSVKPADIYSIVTPVPSGRLGTKYPSHYLSRFPAHEAASHIQALPSYADRVPEDIGTSVEQTQLEHRYNSININSITPDTVVANNTSILEDVPDSYRENHVTLLKISDYPPLEL